MKLGDSTHYVSLDVAETDPRTGDVRVVAHAAVGSFGGEVSAWVDAVAWTAFAQELRELEHARSGSATLESISPGELSLCIRALDRLGHMGIEGRLAHYYYGVGSRQPERLLFEFGSVEFDPTLLPELVRMCTSVVPTAS